MDNRKIKQILDELYKVDNSFLEYENDLVKIIDKLLENKLEIKINDSFVKRLRSELLETLKNNNLNINSENFKKEIGVNLNFMKKFSYIFGGAVVAVAVLFLIYNFLPGRPSGILNNGKLAFNTGEVKKLGDNAFGELTGTSGTANEAADGQSLSAGQAKGLGGGGGSTVAPMAVDSIARTESGGGGGVESMIYPGPVVYKYIYKGAELNLSEEKLEVFRKNIDKNFGQNITGVLSEMNLGLIDLNKFSDVNLSYFNLVEDKELGYGISVDLNSGFVSIYNNDKGWYDYGDTAVMKCLAPDCGGGNGLDISDIPADEELIRMADDFIKEKNINISQYGEPKIEDYYWRREFIMAEKEGRQYYIPDVINVVYPLIINDQAVKDTGGGDYGLRVNINIRKNKVSGLYSLGIYNLESSMYDAVTDASKILNIAEQGGYGYYYYPEGADIIEVEIGEPELIYTSHMNYKDGSYSELFVPALSFPILKQPDTPYYYRENIVVPLVKDLLDNENIYPRPMPLIEPAVDVMEDLEGDIGVEVEAIQE